MSNITVKRCNVLNPSTLLPTPDDGEQHNCVAILQQVCSPKPDLQETHLTNPYLVLFVDGSASRNPQTGRNAGGFAVVANFCSWNQLLFVNVLLTLTTQTLSL